MRRPTEHVPSRPQRIRDRGRRSRVPILGLVLAMALLLGGCAPEQSTTRQTLEWGVFVADDGAPSSDLGVIASMAGDEPYYVLRFAAIDQPVPVDRLDSILNAGRTPILTLEPWVPDGGVYQPAYSLARIAAGDHDLALNRWAEDLATWDRPLLLRFAHEMNGNWYPWSMGVNGNTASDYIAAWNHVHAAFRSAGADQVDFVWAPNINTGATSDFTAAYPGPSTVDYVGLDGYNWGDGQGHTWSEPAELFSDSLQAIEGLRGDMPILVTEVASAEGHTVGRDKAAWIRSLVAYLSRADGVVGFVWFQADKERDWRFNSTAQAQAAMREALAGRPA